MNFYALNAAPINGWETHLGSGQAVMTMLAAGKGANVALGKGSAQLALAASGNGTRRVTASGQISMQLQAAGEGTRWVLGVGTASMAMEAAGNGEVVQGVGGRAIMSLAAQGKGGVLVRGIGLAAMRLQATGEGRVAKTHFGFAHAIMEFRARDIPQSYSTYHGSGTAEMRVTASGIGKVIGKNGGTATMRLDATGNGRAATRIYGHGAAIMRLIAPRVESDQHRQIYGGGSADMAFTATTRDNRVVMLPDSFYAAPRARGLRVATENRGMRVPKQPIAQQYAEA